MAAAPDGAEGQVDQHVDAAKGLVSRVREVLYLVDLGYVAGDGHSLAAQGLDLLHDGVQPASRSCGQGQLGPFLRHHERQGAPGAGTCPGNDRYFARQSGIQRHGAPS